MKVFRRSTKGERSDGKPRTVSIPTKDAIAIVPPKKVIKALYDYTVQNPEQNPAYLSFAHGDFLHVVGREDDPDWYEACNPLHGTRGLVPVNHFETVGKTARLSDQDGLQPVIGHDSGYSEKSGDRHSGKSADAGAAQPRLSSSLGRGSGALVYGIVQYDFKAERPDELDARAGEAIIVIAQSNPEWFVAKPITRLGGPGLIPVSFIEIRDMTTGRAVDDTQAAVQRAGVPKVEEWKKMAADYKNSSIALGRLDSNASSRGRDPPRGNRDTTGAGVDPRAPHLRNGSAYQSNNQSHQTLVQAQRISQLVRPIKAKVPRFIHQNEQYWFVVESVMQDGRHWELSRQYKDFYSLQMSLRERFPEAAGIPDQSTRILPWMPGPVPYVTDAITAGRCTHLDTYLKTLLSMDPTIGSSESVRQFFVPRDGDYELEPDADDDGYRLSGASHHSFASHSHNPQFPNGKPAQQNGNWASPPRQQQPPQQQYQSQQALQQHYQPQQSSQPQQQMSVQNSPYGMAPNGPAPKQLPIHQRNPSNLQPPNGLPAPLLRQGSAMTQGSSNSQNNGMSNGVGPGNTTAALKIKVWFGETNCVVIRLPADFTFASLSQKLRDRWALEPGVDPEANKDDVRFLIEYKDEGTGQFYQMKNDDELEDAMNRNEKLTLRVTPDQGMV